MFPTRHGQMLAGTHGLPMPESDPRCLLTPDPPACPEFVEGDGLGSGRATPTYATIAGRGLFQELCDGVSSKLRHIQEQQQRQEEEHGRKRPSGETAHPGSRPAISTAGPPGKFPQPAVLSLGRLLPPPAEVQPRQTIVGVPPGLGDLPSVAREVISIGTLGHPHTCKEACKYQKRKTGCLMGASCSRCHMCHWHRAGKEPARPAAEHAPPPPPAATHPRPATWRTGTAPRSATAVGAPGAPPPPLAASSRLAAARPSQLSVPWEEPAYVHVSPEVAGAAAPGGVVAATTAAGAEAAPGAATISPFPSVGSIGHPHGCGRACKYAGKANGCKIGHLCNRCHLCRWTRSKEHAYAAAGTE